MSANLDVALVWLEALRTQSGELARPVLADDAVVDDFGGNHHVGRDVLVAFADAMPAGTRIDAPLGVVEEPDGRRITVLGNVTLPGHDEVHKVRWTYLIENGLIVHVVNSRVGFLFSVEDNPYRPTASATWNFA